MRIAVTSRSFSKNPVLRQRLVEHYQDVTFNESGKTLAGRELIGFLKGHEGAIVGLERIDAEVLKQLPDLKVISRFGVGIDTLDISALNHLGIKLAYTAGANKRAVAELVIAFALTLLRQLPKAHQLVQERCWRPIVGRELSGKVLGIIGLGAIGKEVAKLAQAFNCSLIAYDIIEHHHDCQAHKIKQLSLDALLQTADIITLHLPFNPQTQNLLNAYRLALLKPNAILINTARGGLVDETALKQMLQQEKIAGAAFDVFQTEPAEDKELLALPNFFATPHIAGTTEEAILAIGFAAIDGLTQASVPAATMF